MRHLFPALAAVTIAVSIAARESDAQRTAPVALLSGPAIGASLDRFVPSGAGVGDGATGISLRYTSLSAHGIGLDMALGLWPGALVRGGLVVGGDVGAAYNVSAPGATLLLKAGPSALLAVGGSEAAGVSERTSAPVPSCA